jgi:cell wall-associated NlpC family hydrolase
MVTRDAILAEARSWLGTPFQHQARVKGRGVDCAGVVVATALALGLDVTDLAGYSRTPDGQSLKAELDRQAVQVSEALPGDIYLMRFEREPQHLAFATDVGVLHAFSSARKVVEHSLDATWSARIVAVYRFRELA